MDFCRGQNCVHQIWQTSRIVYFSENTADKDNFCLFKRNLYGDQFQKVCVLLSLCML